MTTWRQRQCINNDTNTWQMQRQRLQHACGTNQGISPQQLENKLSGHKPSTLMIMHGLSNQCNFNNLDNNLQLQQLTTSYSFNNLDNLQLWRHHRHNSYKNNHRRFAYQFKATGKVSQLSTIYTFMTKFKSSRNNWKRHKNTTQAVWNCTTRKARTSTRGGEHTTRATPEARNVTRLRRAKLGSYDFVTFFTQKSQF